MMNTDKKVSRVAPSLKVVDDAVAAQKLRELLKDADDGFRRVVKVGLYIEWIAASLPHGALMPWIAAHCADVSEQTVRRWRTMAKNLCEWSGLKFHNLANLEIPAEDILNLPVAQLPAKIQPARLKMDEILDSARTPKQLFLDIGFRQGELDRAGYPKAKLGRRKGEGGATKEQRAAAAEMDDQARLEGICSWALVMIPRLQMDVGTNGIARIDEVPGGDRVLAEFTAAIAYAHGFLQNLAKGRL